MSCNATDAAGNTGSGSFTVTVKDTTPPSLIAADITVAATSAAGIARSFVTSPLTEKSATCGGCAPVPKSFSVRWFASYAE